MLLEIRPFYFNVKCLEKFKWVWNWLTWLFSWQSRLAIREGQCRVSCITHNSAASMMTNSIESSCLFSAAQHCTDSADINKSEMSSQNLAETTFFLVGLGARCLPSSGQPYSYLVVHTCSQSFTSGATSGNLFTASTTDSRSFYTYSEISLLVACFNIIYFQKHSSNGTFLRCK